MVFSGPIAYEWFCLIEQNLSLIASIKSPSLKLFVLWWTNCNVFIGYTIKLQALWTAVRYGNVHLAFHNYCLDQLIFTLRSLGCLCHGFFKGWGIFFCKYFYLLSIIINTDIPVSVWDFPLLLKTRIFFLRKSYLYMQSFFSFSSFQDMNAYLA